MKGSTLESIMEELDTLENRQWLAWAIAGVVVADEKLSKEEEKQMRELFLKHCSPEISGAIVDAMKRHKKIRLSPLQVSNRKLAVKILKHLVSVASIDREIASAEVAYLKRVGGMIGFSDGGVLVAIAWRRREMARQQEAERDAQDVTEFLCSEMPIYTQDDSI